MVSSDGGCLPVPYRRCMSRSRKARRIKGSDLYDLILVSHYAPYCDAVLLDNDFRALASQRNVDVPGRYGVRLFSENNREDFARYLEEVEQLGELKG